jgi:hypothetical protein
MTKLLGILKPAMIARAMSARETPGGAKTRSVLSGEMAEDPAGAARGVTSVRSVAVSKQMPPIIKSSMVRF